MNGAYDRPSMGTPTAAQPETAKDLDRLWADPPGLVGRIKSVQNDAIGGRLLLTGFFFLLLGAALTRG